MNPADATTQAWHREPLRSFDPALRAVAQRVDKQAGEPVFAAGQRPARLYCVVAGEVVMGRYDRAGRHLALQRARDGLLAEASLRSERYHCDAHAVGPACLLAFPLRALRQAIDAHAPTRWAWIAMLSSEIRRQRSLAERLTLKTVRERLLHLLVSQPEPGVLRLTATRKDLAAQLGVSHEALYRAISALVKQGLLRADGDMLALR